MVKKCNNFCQSSLETFLGYSKIGRLVQDQLENVLRCREQGLGKESLRRWTKRLQATVIDVPFVQIEKAVPVAAKPAAMHLRVLANGDVELIREFSDEIEQAGNHSDLTGDQFLRMDENRREGGRGNDPAK